MKRDIMNLEAPEPEAPTLRDMFASAALQGVLASWADTPHNLAAKDAYKYADAMLKARDND